MAAEHIEAQTLEEKALTMREQSNALEDKMARRRAEEMPTVNGLCHMISSREMSHTYGKGFAMLQRMGFGGHEAENDGEAVGCGRVGQGVATPVHAGFRALQNGERLGIGAHSMHSDFHVDGAYPEHDNKAPLYSVFVRGRSEIEGQCVDPHADEGKASSDEPFFEIPPGLPSLAVLRQNWRQ